MALEVYHSQPGGQEIRKQTGLSACFKGGIALVGLSSTGLSQNTWQPVALHGLLGKMNCTPFMHFLVERGRVHIFKLV